MTTFFDILSNKRNKFIEGDRLTHTHNNGDKQDWIYTVGTWEPVGLMVSGSVGIPNFAYEDEWEVYTPIKYDLTWEEALIAIFNKKRVERVVDDHHVAIYYVVHSVSIDYELIHLPDRVVLKSNRLAMFEFSPLNHSKYRIVA